MATTTTNPDIETTHSPARPASSWPRDRGGDLPAKHSAVDEAKPTPSPRDALQALLAFSALHEQVRRRKALAVKHRNFDGSITVAEFGPAEFESEFEKSKFEKCEFEKEEQFVLDEVLQMVAERAVAITGADGIAVALAENNEIVLRAAAGMVRPDLGARIDRDSAFSGACFKTAQIIHCDDTETDPRVNLEACRKLGTRSMVAVPLCGRRRVIGLIEAFSVEPFGFNDSDTGSLTLLAELVVSALKPEDEDRFAQSADIAATRLERKPSSPVAPPKITAPPSVAQQTLPADSLIKSNSVIPSEVKLPAVGQSHEVEEPASVSEPAKPVTPPSLAQPPIPVAIPAKPVEAKAAPAPTVVDAAAPAQPKPSEKTPEATPLEPSTTSPETSPEPTLTFGQTEPSEEKSHTAVLVLLISIVVTAAFAGGVWWKLKTAQLGSAMVTTQTQDARAEQSQSTNATQKSSAPAAKDLTTPPVPGVPSTDSASADQENSETDADDNSPATTQDISKFPRVTGVRHWSSADSSTVVLDLEDQVQYEEHQLSNPDRYYYDLRDTQLAPELAGKSIDVGDALLTRIRIAQPVAGMTRVVLETKPGANIAHPGVSLEPSPYRLVIQVHKAGAPPTGAVNLFPNAATKKNVAIVIPPPTKDDLQLRAHVAKMRIVVDAGHGGWDLGTVGRRGLLEKDLVLEIAQRLGKLLQSRLGADVILTRNDDNYIPLDERAEIANQSQADLFVSVHANYSDLPSARGVETYYTNFFTAPGAKENGSKAGGLNAMGSKDAGAKNSPTLSAADLHERIEQSRRLAASVQRSLYGTLSAENPGLRDRGVKENTYVVLTETAMPGILAEVSFVSSPTDEQKLRSDSYREEIAEALYKGIVRYAASSSKTMKVASAK
jgi:N-acetylmuramoyl-L-alanine amidase/putative methionine-R-sulfoxide reductase with GAF domain